jgi:hypothetical protein
MSATVVLPSGVRVRGRRLAEAPAALAALAVLDGLPADEAVGWVRREYDHKAIETPWQALWVRRVRH